MTTEFKIKLSKLQNLICYKNLSGIILSKQTNFLWITGGKRNDVIKNEDVSLVYMFITENNKYLISWESDAARVLNEELNLLGFELVKYNWYNQSVFDVVKKIFPKGRIGADFSSNGIENIEGDIAKLRIELTDFEILKIKTLCDEYTRILTDFCSNLKPGLSEKEVMASFIYKCLKNNIRLPVIMVGSDDRLFKYRHPVATDKKIEKYLMMATVAERDGLNASITRSVYFGKTPKDLLNRQNAVNYVETFFYYHSKPGVILKELFEIGKKVYQEIGFKDDWKNHIQGGIIAYKPREILATESEDLKLKSNYLMGWNPTVAVTFRRLFRFSVARRIFP